MQCLCSWKQNGFCGDKSVNYCLWSPELWGKEFGGENPSLFQGGRTPGDRHPRSYQRGSVPARPSSQTGRLPFGCLSWCSKILSGWKMISKHIFLLISVVTPTLPQVFFWCSWCSGESACNMVFLHITLETEQITGLHYKPDLKLFSWKCGCDNANVLEALNHLLFFRIWRSLQGVSRLLY